VRTVLLTGSEGVVGRVARAPLEAAGTAVRGFDLVDGDDLRDPASVSRALAGCDAVVHAGAIPHDSVGTPAEIVATTVLGTGHVLLAAAHHAAGRVVVLSSVQVFGFSEGEGAPDYLPVDDAHPRRAARPYGMSKLLVEDMCEAWTRRTGITTVVLRPVAVLDDVSLARARPEHMDLGAFIHVDDLAGAIVRAVDADLDGHVRLTVCGPGAHDTAATRRLLGWAPCHDWPTRSVRQRMQSRFETLRRRVSAR
jgi:UDP-glucose 4-epimerase